MKDRDVVAALVLLWLLWPRDKTPTGTITYGVNWAPTTPPEFQALPAPTIPETYGPGAPNGGNGSGFDQTYQTDGWSNELWRET